jgi:uncharacterized protein YjiS (DUF1127 family)
MQTLVNSNLSLIAWEALRRAGARFRAFSAERQLRQRRLRAANDPHLRDLSDHLLRDIGLVREPGVRADRMIPFI